MSATKPARYGLLGFPLGHSLSPQIHQRLMAEAGIEGTYELVATAPENLDEQLKGLVRDFTGFNITIPYKQQVMAVLDRIDPEADRIGSVNTVAHNLDEKGAWLTTGYNTDLEGFLADAPPMAGQRILILGAGGVCRTLAFAAGQQQARTIRFLVRHADKAKPLADAVAAAFPACVVEVTDNASSCFEAGQETSPEDRWVLLNGTPVGMWPHTGGIPIPSSLLDHVQAVYDTIYNPYATRLVLAAQARGIPAKGGLGMLVNQALLAQKIWNPAVDFPADVGRAILGDLAAEIYRHSPLTLVLAGFMGSGKSRLGRELSAHLGWPLVDLDKFVEQRDGRTIPEIFAADGEATFRALEREALRTVLAADHCQILATGGGALLSEEAEAIVRAHPALVIYLDASLETIDHRVGDGSGRPLIAGGERERMARLYEYRRPLYEHLADLTLDADQALEVKIDKIINTMGLGGQQK